MTLQSLILTFKPEELILHARKKRALLAKTTDPSTLL